MKTIKRMCILLLSASLVACAGHGLWAGTPASVSGGVLTGERGMTLYTFDKDAAGTGKSVCNGACATNWPPFLVADGAPASGEFSQVTRDDGRVQWAFRGKPLYYWLKDQKPGDMTGDGFNNVWRVAKP